MSGVLRTVAKIAAIVGTVAAIASGFGLVAVAGISLATVATVASTVALVATLAAGKPRPPPARGSVSQMQIGANAPTPYPMGRTMIGGTLVHRRSYGAELKKVPNPYRTSVIVLSGVRIESYEATLADFNPVAFAGAAATGYFNGFLYRSTQLGLSPEPAALTAQWAGFPEWSAAHKLSSKAAVMLNAKFDRDGKVFASGEPAWGHIVKGVWAYDPRLDSTYPGGSGPQRIGDESSWSYTVNPALHALTYAIGRRQNGKLVFGPGYSAVGVDVAPIVAWANVCDANGWSVGGVIYEPGDAWANLKMICQAGGGEPVPEPVLTWTWSAPRVPVTTIRLDDLVDGDSIVAAMRGQAERKNSMVPEYRSEAHQWEMAQAEAVSDAGYLAEDGEPRTDVYRLELVQDVQAATELTAYRLCDLREFGPIDLVVKPRFMEMRPGLTVIGGSDMGELGLAGVEMMIQRVSVSPGDDRVTLSMVSETAAKHAFALGRTGVAPPTPSIRSSAELDGASGALLDGASTASLLISTSAPSPGITISATDAGAISVSAHNRIYADRTVAIAATSLTGFTAGVVVSLFYDDPERAGGAVVMQGTLDATVAALTSANPARHYVGFATMPAAGMPPADGGGSSPPGWQPDKWGNYD